MADGLDRLLADDDVLALEEHHAGRDLVPFGVDQRLRPAHVVEVGDDGERRAQVDADGGRVFGGHAELGLEQSIDVAVSAEHSYNFNSIRERAEVDDVVTDRKTAQVRGQFRTSFSHERLL